MKLFNETVQALENSLNYATIKNQAISENIANIDTPNYQAKSVNFKNILDDKIATSFDAKRTDPRHVMFNDRSYIPNQVSKKNTLYNHNGNNVDADKEMAELAKNQIYYQALIDRLNGKFGSLQTVIRGGS